MNGQETHYSKLIARETKLSWF